MTRRYWASGKAAVAYDSAHAIAPDVTPVSMNTEPRPGAWLSVPRLLLLLLGGAFVLRIFYAGHLYEDDGLWFTAAEQVLRGKALYRDIYFDKPPLLPLTYALLFKFFGAHILTIRLFTILYAAAISAMLYWFASALYDRRTGIIAALLFTVFSTTYGAGHMQGLNTDFLMVASYAAAAFAFIRSYAALLEGRRLSRAVCLALIGGVLTGIATQTNPKGIADLVFFTCLLTGSVVLARKGTDTSEPLGEDTAKRNVLRALALLGVAIAGVLLVSIPFLICLWHSDSLGGYWNYVWRWGFRYSNYYPLTRVARRGFWVVAGYFVMNNTLAVALVFAGAPAIYQVWTTRGRWSGHRLRLLNTSARSQESSPSFRTDFRLLLWFGVSLLGVSAGGRFYSHYFFQILPALCLLGARGLISIVAAFKSGATLNSHRRILRRLALGLLVTGFFVTVVRYHSRTFWLAADWIRGRKSQATLTWYHETRNFDERRAAAFLKGLPDPAAAASDMGLEDIRTIPPPPQSFGDSPDTVFVWGYRPWIYYWSGLVPASKYLSAQPLTGIPAGSEYEPGAITPILEAEETSAARAELIKELTAAKPRFIVDEWGMYNPALGVNAYSDVRNFMTAYKPVWSAGNLMIYRRKRYTQTTSSQDGR